MLKKLASITMLLFNLVACIAATFAWFVAAKQNNTSGMQVQIDTYDLSITCNIYKYDDDIKAAVDATNDADAFSFRQYDSVFTSRNEKNSVILVFTITGTLVEALSPITVDVHCTDQTTTNRVTSNIFYVKQGLFNISENTANSIYNSATSSFENISESTFVNNSQKSQNVTFVVSNYANYVSRNALKVYIEMNYSETLAGSFSYNLADLNTTSFSNDITRISCHA
jgi:hypothetical protein